MVSKVQDTTTNTTTLSWTHDELLSIMKTDAEANGYLWPDFGVDEGDSVVSKFSDKFGNSVYVGSSDAVGSIHQVVLTDKESTL